MIKQTETGSSIRSGISACFKKTFPRQTRHNIRSNVTIRSRGITPVRNLNELNSFFSRKTDRKRKKEDWGTQDAMQS